MSDTSSLEGRSALVIDGTSEIGVACVQRLGAEGMTVAFTSSKDDGDGDALARRAGGTSIECDLRDRASCDRAVEHALGLGDGRIDVLVTNGRPFVEGSIEATSEAAFRELLEVNLTAPVRVARACFAPMCDQGGASMILVSSDAGIRAAHETAAFSVASAGVIAASELLAAEGAPRGVRCNAVCPGGGATGADVAGLVAWLACDESAQVTGATLRIDGGAGAAMVVDTRA